LQQVRALDRAAGPQVQVLQGEAMTVIMFQGVLGWLEAATVSLGLAVVHVYANQERASV
jgi:hypothetical protein